MIQNFINYLNDKFPNGILDYGPYWLLTHPWLALKPILRNTKYAWQRVYRGWDDRAIWSIDFYLSKIIPEMLKELKERKAGVPGNILNDEDFDKELFMVPDDALDRAMLRWDTILDEIIEGFEEYYNAQISGDNFYTEKSEKFNKAWDNFRKYFQNLWW